MNHPRWDRRLLLVSMLSALAFLSVCSKSSFLYPMNDWVDVQCFFTMGRSIWDGLVPYRDLYEQKGPVLYFAYALAALISSHSFIGVFLLEVVCFGLFLYFSGLIARLYFSSDWIVSAIIVALAALIPVSPAFAHGSGVEELSLFMLVYSLYTVLSALKQERVLSFREAFFNGMAAAAVLLSKFTILGFYIGLAFFVIFWYCSCRYRFTALLATVGQFLLGVAALCFPFFLYFLFAGALDDLFTVYFYNNLFLYPTELTGSRWDMISQCMETTLTVNKSYAWLLYLGAFLPVCDLPKNWRHLVLGALTFGGLALGTYWGGRGYTYYGLILSAFAVFGLITIARVFQLCPCSSWFEGLFRKIPKILTAALSVALLLSYCYRNSSNTYLMKYSKEELPAYRFAATINQTYKARILNYGFLDGGFYYASDTVPNCEFFCTLNINAPDMWDTQREFVDQGQVEFVITRYYTLDRYTAYSSYYQLVDEVTFPFEGFDYTYYLYKRAF